LRAKIADAYADRVSKYDGYVSAFEVRPCCSSVEANGMSHDAPQRVGSTHAKPCNQAIWCVRVLNAKLHCMQKFVATTGLPRANDFAGVKKFAQKRAEMLKQVRMRW
jgi:hypothetical protein